LGTTGSTLLGSVVGEDMALAGEVGGLLRGEDALFAAVGRAGADDGPATGEVDPSVTWTARLELCGTDNLGESITGDEIDGLLNSSRERLDRAEKDG